MTTLLDLASLSEASYYGTASVGVPGRLAVGASTLRTWTLARSWTSGSMYGALYTDPASSAQVLAFRGTELSDLGDLGADGTLAVGWKPSQADAAQKAVIDLVARPGGGSLYLTGHSLGGALALWAQEVNTGARFPCVTFNAPSIPDGSSTRSVVALSKDVLDSLGRQPLNVKIAGDPVSGLTGALHEQRGDTTALPAPASCARPDPGKVLALGIRKHFVEAGLEAMRQEKYHQLCLHSMGSVLQVLKGFETAYQELPAPGRAEAPRTQATKTVTWSAPARTGDIYFVLDPPPPTFGQMLGSLSQGVSVDLTVELGSWRESRSLMGMVTTRGFVVKLRHSKPDAVTLKVTTNGTVVTEPVQVAEKDRPPLRQLFDLGYLVVEI